MSKDILPPVERLMVHIAMYLAAHGSITTSDVNLLSQDLLIPRRFVFQSIRRLGLVMAQEKVKGDWCFSHRWSKPQSAETCK